MYTNTSRRFKLRYMPAAKAKGKNSFKITLATSKGSRCLNLGGREARMLYNFLNNVFNQKSIQVNVDLNKSVENTQGQDVALFQEPAIPVISSVGTQVEAPTPFVSTSVSVSPVETVTPTQSISTTTSPVETVETVVSPVETVATEPEMATNPLL